VQVRPRGVKRLAVRAQRRERRGAAQQHVQRPAQRGQQRDGGGEEGVVGREARGVARQARARVLRRFVRLLGPRSRCRRLFAARAGAQAHLQRGGRRQAQRAHGRQQAVARLEGLRRGAGGAKRASDENASVVTTRPFART
jgi:hypothetical protein